ncbi:MAG: hypothetical protein GC165_07825 [Armatimonadetes bacterium]|nr:hypothetical protein [Armatimonadota bacterium]
MAVVAAFANGAVQAVDPIEIVDQKDAPFVLRSDQVDVFPKQFVIGSREGQKPGFFLIRESRFDAKLYDQAKTDLKDVTIIRIVRKEKDGKLSGWDLAGKSQAVDEASVPAPVRSSLKEGILAVEIGGAYRSEGGSSVLLTQPADAHMIVNGSTRRAWTTFSSTDKFVDILVRVEGRREVGAFSAKPGEPTSIDGSQFQVLPEQVPLTADKQEGRKVHQLGKSLFDYNLKIDVDWDALQAANPNVLELSSSSESKSLGGDPPTLLVSSTTPIKFWKQIIVIRHSTLAGYFGHVPAAPIATSDRS